MYQIFGYSVAGMTNMTQTKEIKAVTSQLKVLVPLRSPSCTLPLMLSPINVGTLSFLSMTHTSRVKL